MREVLPGEHWACYYRRRDGERVGPATLRLYHAAAEDALLVTDRTRRAIRIIAAKVTRQTYKVGGRS